VSTAIRLDDGGPRRKDERRSRANIRRRQSRLVHARRTSARDCADNLTYRMPVHHLPERVRGWSITRATVR